MSAPSPSSSSTVDVPPPRVEPPPTSEIPPQDPNHHPFTAKLCLFTQDAGDPGSELFFKSLARETLTPASVLFSAISNVIAHLYCPSDSATIHGEISIPQMRTLTLVLEDTGGRTAFVTGCGEHSHVDKEIHLSLHYITDRYDQLLEIATASKTLTWVLRDIQAVIIHQLAYILQYGNDGTTPDGLADAISELVKLKAGLQTKEKGMDTMFLPIMPADLRSRRAGVDPFAGRLDGGVEVNTNDNDSARFNKNYDLTYQFLTWIDRCNIGGKGVLERLNQALRNGYSQQVWIECCGASINELWDAYTGLLAYNGELRGLDF